MNDQQQDNGQYQLEGQDQAQDQVQDEPLLDENGNPNYLLNPLLTDVPAFLRMMERTGIAACVLSSGPGFFTSFRRRGLRDNAFALGVLTGKIAFSTDRHARR